MAEQNQLDMLLRITGADRVAADIKSIGAAADQAFKSIESGAEGAGSAMSQIDAGTLQSALQAAATAAQQLTEAASALAQAIGQLDFQNVAQSLQQITENTQQNVEQLNQLSEAADKAAEGIDNLKESTGQINVNLQQSQEQSKSFISSLKGIFEVLSFGVGVIELANRIPKVFSEAGETAKTAGASISSFIGSISQLKGTLDSIQGAAGTFKTLSETIKTTITTVEGMKSSLSLLATAAGQLAIETLTGKFAELRAILVGFAAEGLAAARVALAGFVAALGPVGIAIGVVIAALVALGFAFKSAFQIDEHTEKLIKLSAQLNTLAEDTGQTFNQIQRGQAAFAILGTNTEKFASIMKKVGEEIKGLDIADEFKEAADEYEKAQQKIARAQLSILQNEKSILESVRQRETATGGALGAAQQAIAQRSAQTEALEFATRLRENAKALAEAEREAADQAKNMGSALRDTVNDIEKIIQGEKDISLEGQDDEKVMRAFKIAMKEAADGGSNLAEVIARFVTTAERGVALKIGKQFGIDAETVDRWRTLNGTVNSADEAFRRLNATLGGPISQQAKEAAERLRVATVENTSAWERFNQALSEATGFKVSATNFEAWTQELRNKFINFLAFLVEKWNGFWASLPLLAKREMVEFQQDWAGFWEDLLSKAATGIEAIASFAPRLGKAIGATKENADALREIAKGFTKDAEDAAIEIQRINDELEKLGSGSPDIRFKKAGEDDTSKKLDEQKKAAELAAKAIRDINLALAALNEKTIDKLTEAAKKLHDQIKEIDKRLKEVQRSLTQEGLQKGIIDPVTGGPMAGQEEAFDALQQRRLRASREADEAKKKAEEEAAKEMERIRQQAEAERQLLEAKKRAIEEELEKRKQATAEELSTKKKAIQEELETRKKALQEELEARKKAKEEIGKEEGPDTQKSKAAFDELVEQAKKAATDISEAFKNIKIEIGGVEGNPFQPLIEKAQQAVNDISQVFQTMGTTLSQAISSGLSGNPFQTLIDAAQEAVNQISQVFQTMGESLKTVFQGFGSAFAAEISQAAAAKDAFIANLDRLIEKLRQVKQAQQGGGGGGFGGGGGGGDIFEAQTGGLLGGKPGIDTNLGWFTRGEFIMRKAATDFWGVDFMHAINQMRRPQVNFGGLMRLLDMGPRRFNYGGLVAAMAQAIPVTRSVPVQALGHIPAYAGGGAVDPGQHVAIDLKIGGQLIGTVHTSEATAAHLQKLSSNAKLVATGTLPNWRRG